MPDWPEFEGARAARAGVRGPTGAAECARCGMQARDGMQALWTEYMGVVCEFLRVVSARVETLPDEVTAFERLERPQHGRPADHLGVERHVEPPPHLLEDLEEVGRLLRRRRHAASERRVEVVVRAHQAVGPCTHVSRGQPRAVM